tara:strand:- start:978 stop:1181 length:204 start_codon:yes stop_codon:yes gene_type:complete
MKTSKTQTAILAYIKSYLALQGYPPSRSEIAVEFGMAKNAAQYHCEQLANKNLIQIVPKVARGIRVL